MTWKIGQGFQGELCWDRTQQTESRKAEDMVCVQRSPGGMKMPLKPGVDKWGIGVQSNYIFAHLAEITVGEGV